MTPKFKIGDSVKLVTKQSKFYNYSLDFIDLDCLQLGEIYEVDLYSNNGVGQSDDFILLKGYDYNHPVDCFELYEDWVPKTGELVEVSNNKITWLERIYLYSTPNRNLHWAVIEDDESDYKASKDHDTSYWKYIRQLKVKEAPTAAKLLGDINNAYLRAVEGKLSMSDLVASIKQVLAEY